MSRVEKTTNGKKSALILWDLACQEDYHVLHGILLADLGLAGGKATTFVLVFRALFGPDVEAKLLYWLRFVASRSWIHARGHVVIILNCFHGKRCSDSEERLWTALIKKFKSMFSDLLDIDMDPFVIDVRVAASVRLLKDYLFRHSEMMEEHVTMPRLCRELHKEPRGWFSSEKKEHLPILTGQALETVWNLKQQTNYNITEKDWRIAASYLHEIGEIIFFEDEDLSKPGNRSFVVPDPQWFCRNVVGELLIPKEMMKGSYSVSVGADGSISILLFQAFFEHLLVEGIQCDDVISMLELIGLCFRQGKEKIIIPALIHEDDYTSIDWESKGFQGVMGRSLVAEDHDTSFIPMTLFRRLQVVLAQNPKFGGRGDSEYRIGKSFSSFKVGELLVLIQFDVDHSDPTDDRIDVLVKSTRNRMKGDDLKDVGLLALKVKSICEIMQKLEELCVVCCPGLRYDLKVIEPSSAADRADRMSHRKLMSLKEIKDLLFSGEEYSSWKLNGHHMQLKAFLSDTELQEVLGSTDLTDDLSSQVTIKQENYDDCKRYALTTGLLTEAALEDLEESERGDERPLVEYQNQDTPIILEAILGEGRLIRRHIDSTSREMLVEIGRKHDLLVKHIQGQQAFSIEEKESSVPRYMFLSRKQGKSRGWISVREAFQTVFELHLLWEAHFDDGFLHEVDGQEGIELAQSREWLLKVSPWLRRSLQVAIMVGKTVGNVYLPGVFNLIPDFNLQNGGEVSAKAVESAATMLVEEDERMNSARDGKGKYGTREQPINVKARLIAQAVVNDLIDELGHGVFAEKIGLRKVCLRAAVQPQESSAKQADPSVLWICDNCYKKYGSRATDISDGR